MNSIYQKDKRGRGMRHVPACQRCDFRGGGWADYSSMVEHALSRGWNEIEGKTLCPDCSERHAIHGNHA